MNTNRLRLEKAKEAIKPGPTAMTRTEKHVLVFFAYTVY